MMRRLFNYISLASAILAVCAMVLWLTGSHLNPQDNHISLAQKFHVGILHNYSESSLVAFNNAEFGPVFNLMTGIADAEGNVYRCVQQDVLWNSGGIYYRYIEGRDGTVDWTLAVNMCDLIVLFAILPAAWIFRHACVCRNHLRGWRIMLPRHPG
jgi:hypothetical protein